MAYRKAKRSRATTVANENTAGKKVAAETTDVKKERLLFGVDSTVESNDVLQNSLTEFEWAVKNNLK